MERGTTFHENEPITEEYSRHQYRRALKITLQNRFSSVSKIQSSTDVTKQLFAKWLPLKRGNVINHRIPLIVQWRLAVSGTGQNGLNVGTMPAWKAFIRPRRIPRVLTAVTTDFEPCFVGNGGWQKESHWPSRTRLLPRITKENSSADVLGNEPKNVKGGNNNNKSISFGSTHSKSNERRPRSLGMNFCVQRAVMFLWKYFLYIYIWVPPFVFLWNRGLSRAT